MRLRARAPHRSVADATAAAYSRAVLPGSRTPWREARWCAVDFELTGLDQRNDQVISFGAIPVEEGRVRSGAAVTSLIRPTRELDEASIRVHGIRAVDLAVAPDLASGISPLIAALTGRIVVFHFAAVDRPFLTRALRAKGARLRGPVIDTEVLGRLWLHERDGHVRRRIALGDLASELGLPAERPHDALGDALTTAQAFIALATHLGARRGETVGSLARAARRLDAARMFHDHSQP